MSKKKQTLINHENGNEFIADVSKSFYCANEKMWREKCKKQCMSCAVEMIRTKAQ